MVSRRARPGVLKSAAPVFVVATVWLTAVAVSVVLPYRWGPGHVFAVFGGFVAVTGAGLAAAGVFAARKDFGAAVLLQVAGLLLGAAGLAVGGYFVSAFASFLITIPVAGLGAATGSGLEPPVSAGAKGRTRAFVEIDH